MSTITLIALVSLALLAGLGLWQRYKLQRTLDATQQQLRDSGLREQQTREQLQAQLNTLEQRERQTQERLHQTLQDNQHKQFQTLTDLKDNLANHFKTQQQQQHDSQLKTLETLQTSLQSNFSDVRNQTKLALEQSSGQISKQVALLTQSNNERLQAISTTVEKRLHDGFEKTTATFSDVIKRLAMIDAAQQKINDLSKDVISLQAILTDKRTRGAFGEVQLNNLIRNVLPEENYALQHTLSNGKRADCMLFLPEPTGNVVIDAKFPLENYQLMLQDNIDAQQRKQAEQQFKVDIRTHIEHIRSKYIVSGETADGAMMFIPAEAVFAEIHAHFPDLVADAQRAHVWLVSPTTMMAILTTARAVLKDAATRKQIHIIQDHLKALARDFERFETRMDNLAKHIHQAQDDVDQVHRSAKKISSRFVKIEKVDLQPLTEKAETEGAAEETLQVAGEE